MVKVFVPRESAHGETRVAVTPETAARLVAAGAEVFVVTDHGAKGDGQTRDDAAIAATFAACRSSAASADVHSASPVPSPSGASTRPSSAPRVSRGGSSGTGRSVST